MLKKTTFECIIPLKKGDFMDVDTYLWKSRSTIKKAAECLGISMNAVSNLKFRKVTPNLLNTLKLIHLSNGQITNLELLSDSDKIEYQNWLCKQKDISVEFEK